MATAADVDVIVELRDAAARWLVSRGIRQWQPGELPRSVVERRVGAGVTWLIPGDDGSPIATVTIDFDDGW